MRCAGFLLLATIVVLSPLQSVEAKGKASGERHHSGYSSFGKPKAQGVARDSQGRIARSSAARTEFRKGHPCPVTGRSSGACPGYVIDHVQPLKRGGADNPGNMQWQTTAAARAKDRTE